MWGANCWHFYLIASRWIAWLSLTKGWAWDNAIGNCPEEFEEAFGTEVTWQFLLKRNLIRIVSESGFRSDVWKILELLFKVFLQISSRSASRTFTQTNLPEFRFESAVLHSTPTFISFFFTLSLKIMTSFWLVDKSPTFFLKLLLKTNLYFVFPEVKQQQVREIGRNREYSMYLTGPITILFAHTPEKQYVVYLSHRFSCITHLLQLSYFYIVTSSSVTKGFVLFC